MSLPDGQPPEIVFIVAIADNGVIGKDNAMPWRLPSDLKRLKAMTIGKPVVMGRKTFQSIGRPLPGRTNIVVTRDKTFAAPGIVTVPTLDAAYEAALDDARQRSVSEIMVIGGADIFAQWMDRATRLEVTEVHAAPEGDVHMPPPDPDIWLETHRENQPQGEGHSAAFSYVTYRRQPR